MVKCCIRCSTTKDLSEFPRYGRKCRSCKNELGRIRHKTTFPTYYSKYKLTTNYREKKKRHYTKLRDDVISHYSNGAMSCKCCGEAEDRFLSIDHIEPCGAPDEKGLDKFGRPRGGRTLYQWLRINNFPVGFQVLCHNCNLGRSLNGGTCPHEIKRKSNAA